MSTRHGRAAAFQQRRRLGRRRALDAHGGLRGQALAVEPRVRAVIVVGHRDGQAHRARRPAERAPDEDGHDERHDDPPHHRHAVPSRDGQR
jgi:hypothetical protein